MNFLSRKTTWSNYQLWTFKVCVFLFGLAGGVWFKEELQSLLPVIFTVALVLGLWMAFLWFKKLGADD